MTSRQSKVWQASVTAACSFLGCLMLPYAVAAQERAQPSDLPPTELARQWLQQDADVREADADRGVAIQQARQLRMSSNEWSVRYQKSRRRYPSGPDSNEWTAQLERPFRLPNKLLIDRSLANDREAFAEASFGEAMHESARSLVDMWTAWQETSELQALLEQQGRVADDNVRAVEARLRSGDAARLDLNLAQADAADVQRRMSEARVEQLKARSRFEKRFGVTLPTPPAPVEPVTVPGTSETWSARIVEQMERDRLSPSPPSNARRSPR